MRRVNLHAPEFDHEQDRDGYRWRGARVGNEIGADQIGGCLYELPDGQHTYPYHLHHGTEEWLLVVGGAPVLRTPEGEQTLREGDVVCFPAGPAGAHQVTGPGTVLILSDERTAATAEYPDSGKIALAPGQAFRLADAVDPWAGE